MTCHGPIFLVIVLAWSAPARGQTLQLPTFETFGYEGSVLVPDQGRTAQGGVNRAASGRSQFGGLPGSAAGGLNRQAVGSGVTAFVHDFEAHDRALRDGAARDGSGRRSGDGSAEVPFAATTARAQSLTQIENSQRQRRELEQAEILGLIERADGALAAQKPNVARIYLKMALRRATGELKNRAARQLAAIDQEAVVTEAIKAAPIKAVPREKTSAGR